ncbi:hypothetical protein CYLTODRAFT_495311 [Cylindrobasidium torrendii FP15055 ss-10]|uniref:Uncharacterized protein n=1 Tax=Cylindrobasidium torrendii FP15055 ss-10 TaxID=1314674 RepID=A0A0D7ATZ9_9AGAR|nr:hypothetical protein CYLTODRAFT_495311 [Cylindrobasidium torrendii FP15055 ss-10]
MRSTQVHANGAGVAVKDAESWLSKSAKDIKDKAAEATNSIGAFIDEQIQTGFASEIKKTIVSLGNDYQQYLDEHPCDISFETLPYEDEARGTFAEELLKLVIRSDATTWFAAQLQRAGIVAAEAGQGIGALYNGLANDADGLRAWLGFNGTASATGK